MFYFHEADDQILMAIQSEFEQSNHFDSSEAAYFLETCLGRLSSFARKLILLRYRHNQTGVRLAEAMDRKVRYVYVALSRTHRTLKHCMRRQMGAIEE